MTFLVAILWFVEPASAVVVYKKGSNKPVAGHHVRQNGDEVVVRDESSSGLKEIIIPRSEIEDFIETVSAERLAALSPSRPPFAATGRATQSSPPPQGSRERSRGARF